jgi:SAM-dependent MidA family methyltransferase
MAGPEGAAQPPASPAWLRHPGQQDITAHVDFTSVRMAAEREGMTTAVLVDQTYFLLGLLGGGGRLEALGAPGQLRQRLALKTLLMPGGLGSTHKVLVLAKGVGSPALAGASYGSRLT